MRRPTPSRRRSLTPAPLSVPVLRPANADSPLPTLPAIEASASARDAFDLMRLQARSGVVAPVGDAYLLYEAPQTVFALAHNAQAMLEDVTPTIDLVPSTPRPGAHPGPARRGRMRAATAPVRSSSLAADSLLHNRVSAAPRDCYCRVDRKAVKNRKDGDDCPSGHPKSVVCI